MEKLHVVLTGISPMLMHSDKLANPLNQEAIAHKEVSGKRKKTAEDQRWLAESEWKNSLYLNADGRIIVPSLNVRSCLIDGAKQNRLGMAVKRGVYFDVSTDNILKYDGPKKIDKLWKDQRFVDARTVKVSTSKIVRYRPKFDEWSIELDVMFDSEIISRHELEMCFTNAGLYAGLGDFRPLFGRFECSFE